MEQETCPARAWSVTLRSHSGSHWAGSPHFRQGPPSVWGESPATTWLGPGGQGNLSLPDPSEGGSWWAEDQCGGWAVCRAWPSPRVLSVYSPSTRDGLRVSSPPPDKEDGTGASEGCGWSPLAVRREGAVSSWLGDRKGLPF